MIQNITRGVPAENAASIAEESIPLPYCSKPMSAVAFEREADFGDASCVKKVAKFCCYEPQIPFNPNKLYQLS